LPWLYTWGSSRFSGIARDAGYLTECIEANRRTSHLPATQTLNELALGS
jgi:putative flavoprotein involved in K+ transport